MEENVEKSPLILQKMQLNFCVSCMWQVVQTQLSQLVNKAGANGRTGEISILEPQDQQKLAEGGSRDGLAEDQKIHLFFPNFFF